MLVRVLAPHPAEYDEYDNVLEKLFIEAIAAWTDPMKSDLSMGVRVRMSALGASRCARLANKTGTIVGGSVYVNSVSVLFDGNRSPTAIHREYVEVMLPGVDTTRGSPAKPY